MGVLTDYKVRCLAIVVLRKRHRRPVQCQFLNNSGINVQQDELWEKGFIIGRVWEEYNELAMWLTWPGKTTYFQQEEKNNERVVTKSIEDGLRNGLKCHVFCCLPSTS